MANLWQLISNIWSTSNEESPVTDASTAEDSIIEDVIERFQVLSKELTDRLAAVSSVRSMLTEHLQTYRESVILAYAAANRGDCDEAKKELEKVLDVGR